MPTGPSLTIQIGKLRPRAGEGPVWVTKSVHASLELEEWDRS